MKISVCLFVLCLLLPHALTSAAAAQESVPSSQYAAPSPSQDHTLMDGLGRGFANMLLGVYELPRNMVYYSVEWPILGIIPGTLQGGGMSVMRVVGGLADLVTVGYLPPGRTVYDLMDAPLYPWESPWTPPPSDNQ